MHLTKYIYLICMFIPNICCTDPVGGQQPFDCCLPLARDQSLTFEVKACENVHLYLTDGIPANSPLVQIVYDIGNHLLYIELMTGEIIEQTTIHGTLLDCQIFKPFWIKREGYSIETRELINNTVLMTASHIMFSSYSVFGVCPMNGHQTEWKFCPEDTVTDQQSTFLMITQDITTTNQIPSTDIFTAQVSTYTNEKKITTSIDNTADSTTVHTTTRVDNTNKRNGLDQTTTESTILNNEGSYSQSPTLNMVTSNVERGATSLDSSTAEVTNLMTFESSPLQSEATNWFSPDISSCICDGKWTFLNTINYTKQELLLLLQDELTELRKILSVDKKSTSKNIRKITSAKDDRQSSESMGVIAIVLTTIPLFLAIISDIHHLCVIINIKRKMPTF